MASTTHPGAAHAVPVINDPRRRRAILWSVCVALMSVVASVSGLNVAQPQLATEFDASQGQVLWIINTYTLTLAALLLPLGVVIINGSPNLQSKTMGLTNLALAALERIMPVEVRRVDVYRLGNGFTSAGDREDVTPQVDDALRAAEQADLLIAATPVFRGSYTGLFKHFFDLIEQYALANKPVLLLATGGSEHHALVLDHALRPLFAFFQALTLPVAVFASSSDFDGTTVLNPRVYSRIQTALEDVEDLLRNRRSR